MAQKVAAIFGALVLLVVSNSAARGQFNPVRDKHEQEETGTIYAS